MRPQPLQALTPLAQSEMEAALDLALVQAAAAAVAVVTMLAATAIITVPAQVQVPMAVEATKAVDLARARTQITGTRSQQSTRLAQSP